MTVTTREQLHALNLLGLAYEDITEPAVREYDRATTVKFREVWAEHGHRIAQRDPEIQAEVERHHTQHRYRCQAAMDDAIAICETRMLDALGKHGFDTPHAHASKLFETADPVTLAAIAAHEPLQAAFAKARHDAAAHVSAALAA